MSTGPRYFIPFRRRREGRTDYYARGKLLLSENPRMVVRKTNREIIIQLSVPEPTGTGHLSQPTRGTSQGTATRVRDRTPPRPT